MYFEKKEEKKATEISISVNKHFPTSKLLLLLLLVPSIRLIDCRFYSLTGPTTSKTRGRASSHVGVGNSI